MRGLLSVLVMAALLVGVCACKQKSVKQPAVAATMRTVDIGEFEKVISQPDVVLLDVRTSEEYAEKHLKNAIQIDVKQSSFRDECLKRLPAGKTIAVYCRTGFRSKSAGNILVEEGFNVINMRGGITAWMEAGKEIAAE